MSGFSMGGQKAPVRDITIDMTTSPGIRSFFEGAYEPDFRVRRVVQQAEDTYY